MRICGCGGWSLVTVSVAILLLTDVLSSLTTTRNFWPLCATVVWAMVKLVPVAPAMLLPFRCHWNVSVPLPPLAAALNVTGPPADTV